MFQSVCHVLFSKDCPFCGRGLVIAKGWIPHTEMEPQSRKIGGGAGVRRRHSREPMPMVAYLFHCIRTETLDSLLFLLPPRIVFLVVEETKPLSISAHLKYLVERQ